MPPNYRFRQEQKLSPTALLRSNSRDMIDERKQELEFGRQTLNNLKFIAESEKEEYKIRQEIIAHKQVAEAMEKISELDPGDTNTSYPQEFAKIMSKLPYAQGDKTISELFIQMSHVHQRAVESKYNEQDTKLKQKGSVDLADHKALLETGQQLVKAGAGTNPTINPDTGIVNFAQAGKDIADAKAKAAEKIPEGAAAGHVKAQAEIAAANARISELRDVAADPHATKTDDDRKSVFNNIGLEQSKLAAAQKTKEAWEALHPGLNPKPAPVDSSGIVTTQKSIPPDDPRRTTTQDTTELDRGYGPVNEEPSVPVVTREAAPPVSVPVQPTKSLDEHLKGL